MNERWFAGIDMQAMSVGTTLYHPFGYCPVEVTCDACKHYPQFRPRLVSLDAARPVTWDPIANTLRGLMEECRNRVGWDWENDHWLKEGRRVLTEAGWPGL